MSKRSGFNAIFVRMGSISVSFLSLLPRTPSSPLMKSLSFVTFSNSIWNSARESIDYRLEMGSSVIVFGDKQTHFICKPTMHGRLKRYFAYSNVYVLNFMCNITPYFISSRRNACSTLFRPTHMKSAWNHMITTGEWNEMRKEEGDPETRTWIIKLYKNSVADTRILYACCMQKCFVRNIVFVLSLCSFWL